MQNRQLTFTTSIFCATLLRVALGYRPFPSIDDYQYIPTALGHLSDYLFAKDFLVQTPPLHTPIWAYAVFAFQHSIGLPWGFWIATYILSLLTMCVVGNIIRTCDASVALIPLAGLLAFNCHESLKGIGRGLYDGFFGFSFHPQWAALLLVFFTYNLLLNNKWKLAGFCLGASFWIHPVVAVHGALVVGMLAVLSKPKFAKEIAPFSCYFLIAAAIPFIRLCISLLHAPATTWSRSVLLKKGLEFRAPHEYILLHSSTVPALATMAFVVFLGGLGIYLRYSNKPNSQQEKRLFHIWLAHLLIAVLAILLHGPFLSEESRARLVFLYPLHLTRTSPLLLTISVIGLLLGLETILSRARFRPILVLSYVAALLALACALLPFSPATSALLAVSIVLLVMEKSSLLKFALPKLFIVLSLLLFLGGARQDTKAHAADSEEVRLFSWVTDATNSDSLFIIPPGMQEFRFYTQRSAYVDFKLCPPSSPGFIEEWRRRLELVAKPDALASRGLGFASLIYWDRTYAQRNTTGEIVRLLRETKADYFIWDKLGLHVPPFLAYDSAENPELKTVYSDARFLVYTLREQQ